MDSIDPKEILETFNNSEPIWLEDDKWHYYTRKKIESFINANSGIINSSDIIINAGSGGDSYGILESNMLHVDLAIEKIQGKKKYIQAGIESIPLDAESADILLCVGSVINYADLIRSIKEFSRLLKSNGYLILEFENSKTLELLFRKQFNANATMVDTFYRNKKTRIWYYSEDWVRKLLSSNKFKILKYKRWHILSPLLLKFTSNSNAASFLGKLDNLIEWIPFINRFSSNVILLCQKNN